jgi:hypothetical protein
VFVLWVMADFSRRQRASIFRFYHGATPAGSVHANVMYAQANFLISMVHLL